MTDTMQSANQPMSSSTDDVTAAPADKPTIHPLNGRWTLSYTGPSKSKNWADSVKTVSTFGTVEEFWGVFNNIPKVEELAVATDYNLFREGIFPSWEDAANNQGGKWLVMVNASDLTSLSQLWLESCLFAIGEQFHDVNEVCGLVVSVRARGHKLCLWTKSALNVTLTKEIGRAWKDALGLPDQPPIKYQVHSESIVANKSFLKNENYSV